MIVEEKKQKSILSILSKRISEKLEKHYKYKLLVLYRKNKIPKEVTTNVKLNGKVTDVNYELDVLPTQEYDDKGIEVKNISLSLSFVNNDNNTIEKIQEVYENFMNGINNLLNQNKESKEKKDKKEKIKEKNEKIVKAKAHVDYDDNRSTIVELHEEIEANAPRIKITGLLNSNDIDEGNPSFEAMERISEGYIVTNFNPLWESELEK